MSQSSNNAALDSLKCPICLDFAENAMEVICCDQVYCDNCLNNLMMRNCPSCQAPNLTYRPSKIVRRVVANLPADCPNRCQEKTTKGELKDHLKVCRNRVYNCPRTSCRFLGGEQEFIKHILHSHRRVMLENMLDYLKEPTVLGQDTAAAGEQNPQQSVKCLFTDNCQFTAIPPDMIEHIAEAHKKEIIEKIPNACLFDPKEAVLIRNSRGDKVEMGMNGKFYCSRPNSVMFSHTGENYTRTGICKPDTGNNCPPCMQMDAAFRNLPYGVLVNRNGIPCQPRPCSHWNHDRGDFVDLKDSRPLLCRRSICGSRPYYACGQPVDGRGSVKCSWEGAVRQCAACTEISTMMGLRSRSLEDKPAYAPVWESNQ